MRRKALVVGGGPAGIEAAVRIGEAGGEAVLVEKEPVLGGIVSRLGQTFPSWEDPRELMMDRLARMEQLQAQGRLQVWLRTVVGNVRQTSGGFVVDLQAADCAVVPDHSRPAGTVEVAAVVLATGFGLFDAARYGEYGYGVYPGVMNSLEFEEMLREWRSSADVSLGKGTAAQSPRILAPRAVAFISCVGSRDRTKGYPYCSKICCMYTAKQAGALKALFPEAQCYVFYIDYRASGKGFEEFVREVIETRKVRYVRGRPSKVLRSRGRLLVRAEDTLMGVPVEVEVDMVVLAPAVIPSIGTLHLARMFGAALDEYGFLKVEAHDPACCGERVFGAGGAVFGMTIPEAQQQGAAAAAEVLPLLRNCGMDLHGRWGEAWSR